MGVRELAVRAHPSLYTLLVSLLERQQEKTFPLLRQVSQLLGHLAQRAAPLAIPPLRRQLRDILIDLLAATHQGQVEVEQL